ncbi:hypothetical protein MIMGU_mgv1a016135mg [Erythranthe guttata]|uniref:Rapid alkalinization factor 1 n=1 Tax=Erythranthe guttata TaxID=4155 RepID=A0A022RXF2_ERYGU|nr:PREDICTED: protein RALF-like 34 [Erythranthe guttata]EYU44408.1 hypothetical protein MIMGU_mgv1a016135mg [Erythranthe guttata]|eukprot:XP_012853430.1 PREDICTED: protein RALF-like 34 [Erythranthe guttata]
MDSPKTSLIPLILLAAVLAASAQVDESTSKISSSSAASAAAMDQWGTRMSFYNGGEELLLGEDAEGAGASSHGRSLLWKRAMHYYISYGALSADRIPCPPRSGRSYYTHNCYRARGPAHPYTRGCSAITQCRR